MLTALKFTVSGWIALQRMQEAEGVAPVLETEIGLAYQDVEVAGVVETHLKVVILIELEKVDRIRELLADFLEVRTAENLEAVCTIIALGEVNGHSRLGELLIIIVHKDARIEGLHIYLLGVLDLDRLLRPATERKMLRGIVTDELIDRREEIEHPLVRQKTLLVERRDVLAIDLTDEREWIFRLRSVLFRDLHHRVLRLRRQIRVAPPFAAAEKVGFRLSGF